MNLRLAGLAGRRLLDPAALAVVGERHRPGWRHGARQPGATRSEEEQHAMRVAPLRSFLFLFAPSLRKSLRDCSFLLPIAPAPVDGERGPKKGRFSCHELPLASQ